MATAAGGVVIAVVTGAEIAAATAVVARAGLIRTGAACRSASLIRP